MNKKNLDTNLFDEQDEKLYEAFIELGWIIPETEETAIEVNPEDDECFPFPPELEDSAAILEIISKRKAAKPIADNDRSETSKPDSAVSQSKLANRNSIALDAAPNLLSLIRYVTNHMPSAIAYELDVTVPFLKCCSDHSEAVPYRCKQELINRACNKFPSLDRTKVQQVVEKPGVIVAAGFRDAGFSGKRMTFQEIVEKTDLSEPAQKFWLKLAAEE